MASSVRGWTPSRGDLEWIDATAGEPDAVVLEMEAVAAAEGIPILDRASGRVLAALAVGRSRIVEVGTAIGYSTLWLARGQGPAGRIVTIDPDRSRTDRARAYWHRGGIADDRIEVLNAPALDVFASDAPALAGPFDLAFIDALKPEYGAYATALRPRLRSGALLVADNVLWSGRTSGDRPSHPGDGTEDLRRFVIAMLGDAGFQATVLPVGDGLLIAGVRG
ncbi:MAG TPA: O-methyltransferase [Candidatus Limnocylindrales bacterium]